MEASLSIESNSKLIEQANDKLDKMEQSFYTKVKNTEEISKAFRDLASGLAILPVGASQMT